MVSPVVKRYLRIGFKSACFAVVVGAGSFWIGAGEETTPRHRDQQTLIGAAVWSQIMVPLGLLISKLMGETLDRLVEIYFVASGMILLFATGIVLLVGEYKSMVKNKQTTERTFQINKIIKTELKYDNFHLCIGILCIVAGCFMLADFVLLLI